MKADRVISSLNPPRKKVIRYIVLLFILLITVIICNTIYSTYQESEKALAFFAGEGVQSRKAPEPTPLNVMRLPSSPDAVMLIWDATW